MKMHTWPYLWATGFIWRVWGSILLWGQGTVHSKKLLSIPSLKANPDPDKGFMTQSDTLHARALTKRKRIVRNGANVDFVCSLQNQSSFLQ